MKTHVCPSCSNVKEVPDLNDGIEPKINLDELVKIVGHDQKLFRVMKMQGMVLELEALG